MSSSDAAETDPCVTQCAGEYFLSESAKLDRVREERKAKQEEALGAKAKQVCGVMLPELSLLMVWFQRAQAFVAPNEEAGDRSKHAVKLEENAGSEAQEMVKKIKAAKAPFAASALGGGLLSGDASKYFAFGHAVHDGSEEKKKKSKREGGDGDAVIEKKKKKAKD